MVGCGLLFLSGGPTCSCVTFPAPFVFCARIAFYFVTHQHSLSLLHSLAPMMCAMPIRKLPPCRLLWVQVWWLVQLTNMYSHAIGIISSRYVSPSSPSLFFCHTASLFLFLGDSMTRPCRMHVDHDRFVITLFRGRALLPAEAILLDVLPSAHFFFSLTL